MNSIYFIYNYSYDYRVNIYIHRSKFVESGIPIGKYSIQQGGPGGGIPESPRNRGIPGKSFLTGRVGKLNRPNALHGSQDEVPTNGENAERVWRRTLFHGFVSGHDLSISVGSGQPML